MNIPKIIPEGTLIPIYFFWPIDLADLSFGHQLIPRDRAC